MRAIGITLLIGSVMTLAWFFLCPTYVVRGQAATIDYYFTSDTTGGQRHHLDLATFLAIDLVIWSSLAGCCCLRREIFNFFFGVPIVEPTKRAGAEPGDPQKVTWD